MPAQALTLPQSPQRILIVRLSAIGDIVMSAPFASAVKQRYPKAHITWLTQPENAALLAHHPAVDDVLIWPKNDWKALWKSKQYASLWRAFKQFRAQLKARHFDVAIDLQGLLKSALWAFLCGAKIRIGLGSKEGSQHLMTINASRPTDYPMIASEYRTLAANMGLIERAAYPWSMGLSEADKQQAAELLKSHQVPDEYAIFCPFTTRAQKHWIDERWMPLLSALNKPVVVLGGPADRAYSESLFPKASPLLFNLTGQTPLRVAAALIQRAQLLVGVDTGLTHMGIALGTASIGLFGSTRPYLQTGRKNAEILYHARDCSPCRRNPTCDGRFDCMRDLQINEIVAKAQTLWGCKP